MTQFLRDQASDSEEVVTPLMLDGTYLSRNFSGRIMRVNATSIFFFIFLYSRIFVWSTEEKVRIKKLIGAPVYARLKKLVEERSCPRLIWRSKRKKGIKCETSRWPEEKSLNRNVCEPQIKFIKEKDVARNKRFILTSCAAHILSDTNAASILSRVFSTLRKQQFSSQELCTGSMRSNLYFPVYPRPRHNSLN